MTAFLLCPHAVFLPCAHISKVFLCVLTSFLIWTPILRYWGLNFNTWIWEEQNSTHNTFLHFCFFMSEVIGSITFEVLSQSTSAAWECVLLSLSWDYIYLNALAMLFFSSYVFPSKGNTSSLPSIVSCWCCHCQGYLSWFPISLGIQNGCGTEKPLGRTEPNYSGCCVLCLP